MTLPAWMYRNPLTVLVEQESRTCAGCVHEQSITLGTGEKRETTFFCARGKRYGRRCRFYEEKQ
jgi:hypothetical protein